MIVAAVLTRQERLAPHRIAGVLMGFAGVVVMLAPTAARPAGADVAGAPLWAQLACLGAAVSYAFAAAFAHRFKALPVMVSAAGQLTGSSVLMLPLALWQGASWSPAAVSATAWANVAAVAILATALAYLIYFRLLTRAGATNASLVTLLVPVNAVLIGAILLGESLTATQAAGLVVLMAGLLVLDGRVLARRPRLRRA